MPSLIQWDQGEAFKPERAKGIRGPALENMYIIKDFKTLKNLLCSLLVIGQIPQVPAHI